MKRNGVPHQLDLMCRNAHVLSETSEPHWPRRPRIAPVRSSRRSAPDRAGWPTRKDHKDQQDAARHQWRFAPYLPNGKAVEPQFPRITDVPSSTILNSECWCAPRRSCVAEPPFPPTSIVPRPGRVHAVVREPTGPCLPLLRLAQLSTLDNP